MNFNSMTNLWYSKKQDWCVFFGKLANECNLMIYHWTNDSSENKYNDNTSTGLEIITNSVRIYVTLFQHNNGFTFVV